jgi:type IV pilus biogenesis protein PilP
MADKVQTLSSMTPRQKVTAGVVVLVVLIIIWQLWGMFGGGDETPAPIRPPTTARPATQAGARGPDGAAAMPTPKPTDLTPAKPMTEREAELMRLQQETQVKYLEALNQLQMLKVQRDIANTSKDISTAKLASVTSEKKIVDMLSPPAPPPTTTTPIINKSLTDLSAQDVRYTVVSVSQVQYRWGAVLSYKGSLYNVHVGDVLSPDGSTVVAISRNGVTIQKDGVRKRLPLITSI